MIPGTSLALVSLGSNIDARANLSRAVALLAERSDVHAVSRVWRSKAVGGDGPDFLNAAVAVATSLDAAAFKFALLRPIEAALGRVRTGNRFAPRTIDLDLALFGDAVVNRADGHGGRLRLPDPDIVRYAHVAVPLADIAGDLRLPGDGRRLRDIAAACVAVDAEAGRAVPRVVLGLDLAAATMLR
ncbi:MAG: 2-amino-4-hydroxy-6-hydroxymethyldihydropteridine diphosphokinase [Ardenticatenales bacterium]|nr:2-amino-4-hydroxy-6-hydroxymethyldihydropteridine diphosphokinase [Ardenticatenales bacterium]